MQDKDDTRERGSGFYEQLGVELPTRGVEGCIANAKRKNNITYLGECSLTQAQEIPLWRAMEVEEAGDT